MKKTLITFAIIWGIVAVVLFFSSFNKLDSRTAQVFGTSTIINIQATVFCAACVVMCCINAVGAMILSDMEYSSSSTIEEVHKITKKKTTPLEDEARE